MKEGKEVIRKAAIEDGVEYVCLVKDEFYIKKKKIENLITEGTDNLMRLSLSTKDILATDWEEVEG